MSPKSKRVKQDELSWGTKKAGEATAYLSKMVDYIPDALIAIDNQHKVIGWNTGAEQVYGWSAAEVLGKPLNDFFKTAYYETNAEQATQTVVKNGVWSNEVNQLRKDGKRIPIWSVVATVKDAEGTLLGFIGINRDIAERKQAEEALQNEHDKMEALIENVDGSLWSVDAQYRLLVANEQFHKGIKFALGRSFLAGESVLSPDFPKDALKEWKGYYDRALRGEKFNVEIQTRFVKPAHFVEYRFNPIKAKGGSITGVTVLGQDITNRKHAEAALKISEERFHSAIESLLDGFAIYATIRDETGNITDFRTEYVNQVAGNLTGRPRAKHVGRTVLELHPNLKEMDIFDKYCQVVDTGEPVTVKDYPWGDKFYEFRLSKLGDGFLSVWSDVTERVHTERQLLQMKRLYATLRQVNQAIAHTQQVDELYQSMCDVAVKFGEFALAWIGLLDEITGDVKPVAANGLDLADWPLPIFNIRQGEYQEVLAATAIRTSKVTTSEDVLNDERTRILNEQSIGLGYRSLAAVPFRLQGRTMGVLNLVSSEAGFFKDKEELRLLREMGLDISFALDTMELEVKRRQTEEDLRASEEKYRTLFTRLPISIAHCRMIFENQNPVDYEYIDVNPEFEKITGLKDVVGKKISEVIPNYGENNLESLATFGEVAQTGQPKHWEHYLAELAQWYSFTIYSPVRGEVIIATENITERRRAEKAVLESEMRFHRAIEAAGAVPYFHDYKTNSYSFMGNGILQLTGYTAQEITPTLYGSLEKEAQMVDNAASMTVREASKLMQAGQLTHWRCDSLVVAKDGTRHWIADTSVPVFAETGEVSGSIGFLQDITVRKQAETALQESEKRYRGIFEGVQDAIFVEDINGQILDINQRACEIFGYSREEFLTKTVRDLVPLENEILGFEENDPDGVGSGPIETVNIRANGERFPVEISGRLSIFGDQRAMLVILRDIAKRKVAEEALRAAEENYRSIFENAVEGIYQSSLDGHFLTANPAFARMLGFESPQELITSITNISDQVYIEPARRDDFQQLLAQQGSLAGFEYQVQRKDGHIAWLSDNARAVCDAAGQILYYEGFTEDITERKKSEQHIQRQIKRLNALHDIDNAIKSSVDLRVTLNIVLEQLTTQLNVDAASVLLFNRDTHTLDYVAGRGFNSTAIQHTRLQSGRGFAGQAMMERRIIRVPNLTRAGGGLAAALSMAGEFFMAYIGVPLIVKGQVLGVLEIFQRHPRISDPEWFAYLENLTGQAAIAIDNAQLFENLQRSNFELTLSYDATIEGWSRAMELRDEETEGHTQRVTNLTLRLARQMGIPEANILQIRRGTLLHDIGKIGIPDRILLKPGPLTDEERMLMHRHPIYAREMLSPIPYLKHALDIPYCHHEKWDGTGYPQGLKGEQIPLAARIFAVVDVWDALTSDRPYRPAWTKERTIAYLQEQSGKHFDPEVAQAFLQIVTAPDFHLR